MIAEVLNFLIPSSLNKDEDSIILPNLKRASSVLEKNEPDSKGNTITFINKTNIINHEDLSLFDEEYQENIYKENSFILEDRKNEKDSEQKTKNSIFKEEGPNLFITEDDIFFEEILRNKLLEEAKLKFSIKSLTHLDNLKVPFPEDNENLDNLKFYKNNIEKIERKLEGKFILRKLFIKLIRKEDILSFINKEEGLNNEGKNLVQFRRFSEGDIMNLFVGINIKKRNKENYSISYMFAELK